jgi:hypothetical protein
MKRCKRCVLMVAMIGTTVLPVSCSGAWLRSVRNAAIEGTAAFVQESTFTLLDSIGIIPADNP